MQTKLTEITGLRDQGTNSKDGEYKIICGGRLLS